MVGNTSEVPSGPLKGLLNLVIFELSKGIIVIDFYTLILLKKNCVSILSPKSVGERRWMGIVHPTNVNGRSTRGRNITVLHPPM